jgi:hypothetical protein
LHAYSIVFVFSINSPLYLSIPYFALISYPYAGKKRYVMLNTNLLYYFESESSAAPSGIVQLDGCVIQLSKQMQFKGQECVAIKTKTGRCFYFYGSSYENKTWFDAIRALPNVKLMDANAGDLTESSSSSSASGASISAAPPSTPSMAMTLADMPEGKKLLDPARELGVTDAVNALMTSLPPDVQVVWLQVLSAACKSRETEENLANSQAKLAAAGEALESQKRAAAALALSFSENAEVSEKLKSLVDGAAGAATLAGASDAYSAGRADAEAQISALRLEFEASLIQARATTERETEVRLEAAFAQQLEAAVAAARAAEKASLFETSASGSQAEWEARVETAARDARTEEAAKHEDETNELLRRIAGLEASLKQQSAGDASSGTEAELRQALAVCQGQLSQVGTQLELALVKAESGRLEAAGKESRVRQLETELSALTTKLNKQTQEHAEEYVKMVKLEQEQKRLRERLDKAASAEKYMGFQADEIMQAKANYLKMKDQAEEFKRINEALERELLNAREMARGGEETSGAREAAEREAQRALDDLERVRADKAELEQQLARIQAASEESAGSAGAVTAEMTRALESQVETLRAETSKAISAEQSATQNFSRLSKTLAAVVNTVRESLNVKDRVPMVAGDALDMFAFRDELRQNIEVVSREAAARAEATEVFARKAVEKKMRELEGEILRLNEEKAGLEKELTESDINEERTKRDVTAWMTRANELEGEKKAAEDRINRLDTRVHQLEMNLAEAKAKLYNLSTPHPPEPAVKFDS